jgi:MscS family membrane protein
MSRFAGSAALLFMLFWSPVPTWPQTKPGPPTKAEATAPATVATAEDDPWGRTTPRGTVVGFMMAILHQDYGRAGMYLETRVTGEERDALVRQLETVLNRLPGTLENVSRNPAGDPSDGRLSQFQRVGTVESNGEQLEIVLKRIQRPTVPAVWLFSAETLRRVPDFSESLTTEGPEGSVPSALLRTRFLTLPVLAWLALMAIPLSWVVASIVLAIIARLARALLFRGRPEPDVSLVAPFGMPLRIVILATILRELPIFGGWLVSREFLRTVSSVLLIIGLPWLLTALVTIVAEWRNRRLERTGHAARITMVRVISRTTKAVLAVSAFLALLYMANVNLTAVFAGLGVGGLAVAFAAKTTLENVFGGLLVISDHRIRVGDYCRAGAYEGTIEDISLPSTRIRTVNRTVVFVPNSQMSGLSVENFSFRDKFWFYHTLRLAGDTSGDQMRDVLTQMRRVLDTDSKVAPKSPRVRLIGLKDGLWEIEIAAYLLTRQFDHFLEIQERVLLGLLDVIERSGTAVVNRPVALIPGGVRDVEQPDQSHVIATTAEGTNRRR